MSTPNRPENLPGGCLCGAIRFKVNINDIQWPPDPYAVGTGTCQCTMCRKHTGCLVMQSLTVPRKTVSPPLESNASYKTYKSSSFAYRGFCSTCGSSLTFNYDKTPDAVEILLGLFDEDLICGKKDEANAWSDAHGEHVPRVGGIGQDFCGPLRHLWLENAVAGVTDNLPGKQYLRGSEDGDPFTGRLSELRKPQ